MANTQKTREEIKKYFKKYSSPTVEQWHTVLDSVLNLLSDLPLDFDQIKDLTKTIEGIKEELEKTKNGTSENTLKKIQQVKEELEKAIAKKADTAEGGAGYVPQLFELKNDDPYPVGAIAQYIGATDYDRDLIRGFFYEKKPFIPESDPYELVDGDPVSITKIVANWTLGGTKYISKNPLLDPAVYNKILFARYNDRGESVICVNTKYLATQPDETQCFREYQNSTDYDLMFPLIAITQTGEEVPFEVGSDNCVIINGREGKQSGSVNMGLIYKEDDKQAFICSSLGSWAVIVPAAVGKYENTDFLVDNIEVFGGAEQGESTWLKDGETVEFTPQFLRGVSSESSDPVIKWQIIQTSPTMM